MAVDAQRGSGQSTKKRVRTAVRARRRVTLRERALWVGVGLAATLLVFALVRGGNAAWFALGAIVGSLSLVAAFGLRAGRERRRPAVGDGERATAAALRPLEAAGWRLQHSVQTEYGNLDHVAESPRGTVYVLESKNLSGTLALEDRVLVQRFEDGHERWLGWIASRVRGQAATLADSRRTNGTRPWVQGVVVLWGEFRQRPVELDRVWYVRGDELAAWLRSRD
jgi:hypothetical protein